MSLSYLMMSLLRLQPLMQVIRAVGMALMLGHMFAGQVGAQYQGQPTYTPATQISLLSQKPDRPTEISAQVITPLYFDLDTYTIVLVPIEHMRASTASATGRVLGESVFEDISSATASKVVGIPHPTQAPTPQPPAQPSIVIGDDQVYSPQTNQTKPIVQAHSPVRSATPRVMPPIDTGAMEQWFQQYAAEYGANAELMKQIAQCESGMNPNAISSTGLYHGLFQFVASTWSSNRNAMGLDPDPALRSNPEEAIRTAAFKMGRDGYGAWPACSKKALAHAG